MTRFCQIILIILSSTCVLSAQNTSKLYGIVIKGGHLIDPKNNIDELMDIAINDGKIALIAKHIKPEHATQVVNAEGMYISPGLIDIHSRLGLNLPDGYTLRVGVTTIVDAGDSDWKSFPDFKARVIDQSVTRVLAMLNIEAKDEQTVKESVKIATEYKNDIVGFKVNFTGVGWTAVSYGLEAGNALKLPIMLDGGRNHPYPSLKDLFTKYLRKGDIYTHTYTIIEDFNARDRIVDQQSGKINPAFAEAQAKGIIFDVGHGSAFRYSNAIPAMEQGFLPNTISTDISMGSVNAFMKDMMNVMSKFLTMGMSLKDVIKASTWSPAKSIKRKDLGHLSPGAIADLLVFSLREGKFGFYETAGFKMEGSRKFECEITIKGGRIVYDLNGIAMPLNNFFREGNQFRQ